VALQSGNPACAAPSFDAKVSHNMVNRFIARLYRPVLGT